MATMNSAQSGLIIPSSDDVRQPAKDVCPKSLIVGERKFKIAIFGLTTGKPDYVVYVKGLRSSAS